MRCAHHRAHYSLGSPACGCEPCEGATCDCPSNGNSAAPAFTAHRSPLTAHRSLLLDKERVCARPRWHLDARHSALWSLQGAGAADAATARSLVYLWSLHTRGPPSTRTIDSHHRLAPSTCTILTLAPSALAPRTALPCELLPTVLSVRCVCSSQQRTAQVSRKV